MRVGVVGVGRMGSFHAKTLRGLHAVSDLVLVDADLDRARSVASELDAEVATDVEGLLATKPEAIVVAASTSDNLSLVRRCLAAGVASFCEKPVTLDSALCRRLIEDIESQGGTFQVGFQRRFDAEFLKLRQAVSTRALGRCYSVRMVSCDAEPPHPSYVPRSGGIFKDLQIHDFDLLPWLVGQDPVEIFAMGVNREDPAFAQARDFDGVTTMIRLADNTLATLVAGRYNPAGYDVRVEIATAGGTFSAGNSTVPYSGFVDRFMNAYIAEMAAFLELVQGRIANPCPPQAALRALEVAEAAGRAARTGRPVRLNEV